MCGIAGLVAPSLSRVEIGRTLQRMTDSIVHRGPDDEGFFVADGVGLGMRRLSIIDLAGGRQPIANEDRSVQVVFNGEIYNYPELRTKLEAKGHLFKTRSDTEVIVHGYEENGVGCFETLRGMFGIAIWDEKTGRLLLARDPLGKKPLYYAQRGDNFWFGSEMKAILAADPTLAEPDPEALIPYFRYGFVSEPGTMFKNIWKLPAAHWLIYQNGQIKVAPYWQLRFGDAEGSNRTLSQWIEELDALLEEAVRIRLMSEVPLGVFLSGGLDSSAIVAYMHKAKVQPLKTFTIGFDRPEWDESADAEVVAKHFQTDHHLLTLREQDLTENLPDTLLTLVRHFDEPFGDYSSIPTYHVSKLAREHVTVILGGDGGDELFAGYSTYQGIRFAEYYRQLPVWLGRTVLPNIAQYAAKLLPTGKNYTALRAAKVLHASSLPFDELYFSKKTMCPDDFLRKIFSEHFLSYLNQSDPYICEPDIVATIRSDLPVLSKASYGDIRFRLLNDMLVKVDRMSMAHSLEVRSPFLDHRLLELVARIPPKFKLRGWQTKAILRDTLRRYLPPQTLRKRKQGFSVPLREWFRSDLLNEMVGDYLEAENHRLPHGMFNHSAIRALLVQHRNGERDHSSIIWLLLNYAAWYDLYIL
ncbi:MAG: asparagine synthase (glutamine-hydrolyzing) [Ardenticatenaceae bacterium]